MKNKIKFFLVFFAFVSWSQHSFSQRHIKSTIIKTNILNLIMLPSLHVEQQISKRGSLQLNLHRASLVFISENEVFNGSVDYRHYFFQNSKNTLKGFYLSPGVNIFHNYLYWKTDAKSNLTTQGISQLGLQFKTGYQWLWFQDRMSLDIGTGGVADIVTLQKDFGGDQRNKTWRFNISFGLNLTAFPLIGRGNEPKYQRRRL